MKEQLISFETAKLAKEKGFNFENCSHYLLVDFSKCVIHNINPNNLTKGDLIGYSCGDKTISAPTQSLLQKWLREVHNIHIAVLPKILPSNEIKYYCFKGKIKKDFKDLYNTYEEALEKGLQEALKLI